jgi:hypothetical protein
MICDKLSEYFNSSNSSINYGYEAKTVKDLMEKEFKRYSDFIKNSAELCVHKDEISVICNQLVEIIKKYEDGYIQDSIKSMEQLMTMVRDKDFLKEITVPLDATTMDTPFYRMRVSDEYIYRRGEIFHIPLSKRRTVRTQRYSIPGFPCLYLSSSVYTCWEELNKPPLDKTYISRFVLQPKPPISLFDMSLIDPKRLFFYEQTEYYQPSLEMHIENVNEEICKTALVLWPLIFSCSLYGSSDNDFYKPEYVIPQLLLQWIRKEKNIDGIAYIAIRHESMDSDIAYCKNYVFPIKDSEKEFCRILSKNFKFTQPIRCDELNALAKGRLYGAGSPASKKWFKTSLVHPTNNIIYYENTIFGEIESNICQLGLELDFIEP